MKVTKIEKIDNDYMLHYDCFEYDENDVLIKYDNCQLLVSKLLHDEEYDRRGFRSIITGANDYNRCSIEHFGFPENEHCNFKYNINDVTYLLKHNHLYKVKIIEQKIKDKKQLEEYLEEYYYADKYYFFDNALMLKRYKVEVIEEIEFNSLNHDVEYDIDNNSDLNFICEYELYDDINDVYVDIIKSICNRIKSCESVVLENQKRLENQIDIRNKFLAEIIPGMNK